MAIRRRGGGLCFFFFHTQNRVLGNLLPNPDGLSILRLSGIAYVESWHCKYTLLPAIICAPNLDIIQSASCYAQDG